MNTDSLNKPDLMAEDTLKPYIAEMAEKLEADKPKSSWPHRVKIQAKEKLDSRWYKKMKQLYSKYSLKPPEKLFKRLDKRLKP